MEITGGKINFIVYCLVKVNNLLKISIDPIDLIKFYFLNIYISGHVFILNIFNFYIEFHQTVN